MIQVAADQGATSESVTSFLNQLFRTAESDIFTFPDIALSMVMSTLLTFVVAHIYRLTHRGTSYSQSFLVTMFLMAVTTSVVMLIIGSNIARAFSLVGALSIIRFRTAVKDSRDTGYLFAAMVIGMGCGTQFYVASISLTAFVSGLMLVLYVSDYGIKRKLESIVRVTYTTANGAGDGIESALDGSFKDVRRINRMLDVSDGQETDVYVVRQGKSTDSTEAEQRLRDIEGVVNIAIYESDQHAPF
jgi:hypothetical protein